MTNGDRIRNIENLSDEEIAKIILKICVMAFYEHDESLILKWLKERTILE